MTRPADSATREQALRVDGSFIVQAPAGSGKTELLIRRFLSLLAIVEAPEEIIAITFTIKAAAEMRHRVMQALADAQGPEPEGLYERELWLIAGKAWANNVRFGWQLDRHPARLRIQTIDALCAALVRQMPWVSGFGAPPQVVEDAGVLYRAAARATLQHIASGKSEWRDAVTVLLGHLDNQVPRAIELLSEMLRYRDQWLRHLGRQQGVSEKRRRAVLESAWSRQIHYELRLLSGAVPGDVRQQVTDCIVYAAENLSASGAHSPIVAWRDASSFAGESMDDLPRWRGLSALLLKQDGGWRKVVNVRQGFPPRPKAAADMKKTMHDLLQVLAGNEHMRTALERAGRVPEAGFDHRQWRVVSALATLLPLAAAQLGLLFGDKGQVDFCEINLRANLALGALDVPSDLALRLDYRISHLLVDEFQDTSFSQYELIDNLTGGWTEGDGRTLFLVGDPMQSIYRFREAEVALFTRVREQGMNNIRLTPLTLTVNFRSDPRIVAWVNDAFRECFPENPDPSRGAVGYIESVAYVPAVQNAGVSVHPFVDAPRGAEAQCVAELIRAAWRHDAEQRIAILVRSRQSLQEILPALDTAKIPYSGVDIHRLDGQPVVQDLLSLTRALSFPADRIAWLSVLRAPWCGLTLHDLHTLVGDRPRACVWDCLQDDARRQRLSRDGQRRVTRFMLPVTGTLENRGRLPLARTVENVWLELGGPACISDNANDNARLYFDLLREFQRRGGAWDLEGLAGQVAKCWSQAGTGSDQRLQIMTLHKAKGLEFDTVIIPGLHKQPGSDDTRLLLWEEQMYESTGSLLFAPSAETGPGTDPHYDYLRAIHAEKDHFETLRLLYVGCTRARRRLHLLGALTTDGDGHARQPHKHSLLSKLWRRLGNEFDFQGMHQQQGPDTLGNPVPALHRLPVDWTPVAAPAAVTIDASPQSRPMETGIEFSWAGEVARHVGVIVHEVLDGMALDGMDQWSADRLSGLSPVWHTELLRLGVSRQVAGDASSRILAALVRVLDDDRARWLLSGDHLSAESEYAMTWSRADSTRNFRIDRTFIDHKGIRWIVDFKSSTHAGSGLDEFLDSEQQRYRQQLDDYAGAMFAMEKRPIRLGLYFPLLGQWREWAYER